jgi:hypothetical protein
MLDHVMATGEFRSRKVVAMWIIDPAGAAVPERVVRGWGRVPSGVFPR